MAAASTTGQEAACAHDAAHHSPAAELGLGCSLDKHLLKGIHESKLFTSDLASIKVEAMFNFFHPSPLFTLEFDYVKVFMCPEEEWVFPTNGL